MAFLGKLGKKDGVKPISDKVRTITEFPEPKSAAEENHSQDYQVIIEDR